VKDVFSKMLRDKEPIFFSSRYLAKLEKMKKECKNTVVYMLKGEQIGSCPQAIRAKIYSWFV